MLISPSSLAMRNVSSQGIARDPAGGWRVPGRMESNASPWSASMAAARKASSAQYWSSTFTGRPIAAAPAARVPAACSLSSVPEKRTSERVSSMGSLQLAAAAMAGAG